MEKRTLGQSGLEVSALGLGCMSMSGAYGDRDEAGSIETLNRALEVGITFFDTADIYGVGHNETLIGKTFAGRFDQLTIATKCGFVETGSGSGRAIDGSPAHIREACDASLKRLGIETIDLYYLHRPDPTVPIEDSVGAIAELIKDGKVRYVGLSEVSANTLRRAATETTIAAVQSEYSIFTRGVEAEVLPACRECGTGFVPFGALGRGMLTGQIRSRADFAEKSDLRSRAMPRFSEENFPTNLKLVETLEGIATAHDATAAQVALAWALAQGPDIVPIPGTAKAKNLENNTGAVRVALTPDNLATLSELSDAVAGERYPGNLAAIASVETPPR